MRTRRRGGGGGGGLQPPDIFQVLIFGQKAANFQAEYTALGKKKFPYAYKTTIRSLIPY